MKVAIVGFGQEGRVSYEYYRSRGHEVVVVDENSQLEVPVSVEALLGPDVLGKLAGFDLIIRSPGINPAKLPYPGKVWSLTNEFFAQCEAPIIGVTGTKGKGTTSSLIAAILKAGGKSVHLIGNIGVPALEALPNITPDDIVVYELSSFQLWDIEKSPQVAVVLGIEPDHLDVHADFADYVVAKSQITHFQSTVDRVIYKADDTLSARIAERSVGQRLEYPSERTAHVRGSMFYYGDSEICEVGQLQLPGEHNIENACAAITAVWPWVSDGAVIAEGLRSFDGLPHRLKLVGEIDDVRYYDDSIATTPGSAIAAIKAFAEPKVIILGGSDKGAQYDDVVQLCKETDTRVVAIGQTGGLVYELCGRAGVVCERVEGGMAEVVAAARSMSKPGDVVILSPASASFDQYKDYADRGDQFIAAIEGLK